MVIFAIKSVLFVIMNVPRPLHRLITLKTTYFIIYLFCFLTSCRDGNDSEMAWNTGNARIDQLLERADFYEHPDHVDPDSIDAYISLLQKESGCHDTKASKAAALWAASRIAIYNDEYEDAYAYDSTALTIADSSATHIYIHASSSNWPTSLWSRRLERRNILSFFLFSSTGGIPYGSYTYSLT